MQSDTELVPSHQWSTSAGGARNERYTESTGQQEDIFVRTRRSDAAFALLGLLAIVVALEATSIAVALPDVAAAIDSSAFESFWIGSSFLLAATVMILQVGSVSHIFGRPPVYTFCVACFTIGSIICATAREYPAMCIGRILQGVGGGGTHQLTNIIVTDIVPFSLRGPYVGMMGGFYALGSIVGPAVGGALAQAHHWRFIFWTHIPVTSACAISVPLLITLAPTSGAMSQKLRRIDWVGNVLFTLSMTSFLVPVTWGGVQVPWSSWRTIIPLVLGAVGTVGFCLYERCVAKEPILRLHLFRSFNMAFSFIAIFFHGASMYVSMYFLPLYFEAIHGYTPLTAGLAFLPSSIIIVPAAIAAGIVVPKRVNFRVALVFGWLVSTTSYGCCLLLKADSIPAVWVALSVSTSLGLGITMSSISLLNQAAARNTDVGFAVSAFSFFRYLGQCFGVSLAGTIFQNIMRTHLPTALMSSSDTVMWTKDAISLVRTMKTIPNEPTRLAVQDAFGWGLFSIWAFICGLNGFALIGSIFIGNM